MVKLRKVVLSTRVRRLSIALLASPPPPFPAARPAAVPSGPPSGAPPRLRRRRAASLRAALPLPPAAAPVQPQPTSRSTALCRAAGRSAAACGAARQRRGRRGVKSTLNFLSAFCAWSSETVERTLVQLVSLSIYTYCFIFL